MSKYKSWVQQNKGNHSFTEYLVRYSIIMCCIILGITLISSILKVDILILPVFYFGKLTLVSFVIGILAVWVHLKIYTKRKDINNLVWIHRKRERKSSKGNVVTAVILLALLVSLIYNYLKYQTIFLAFEKINGSYQISTLTSGIEKSASILVIVLLIISIFDFIISRSLDSKGTLILLSLIQLVLLYFIKNKVFNKAIDFKALLEYSLKDYLTFGIYIIIAAVIIQTIIVFILRLVDLCLLLHDKMIYEV
jgi:hypothetical protein